MARATHVKAARKKIPESVCDIDGGIKKGSPYYWWKFRRGGKHYSLTAPKRSQLTQSAFYSVLWDIEDRIAELTATADLQSDVPSLAEEIRSLGDEAESSLQNMPDSLQQGPTGEMLQGRKDACDSAADELEGIDLADFEDEEYEEPTQDEGETDDDFEERKADELAEWERGKDQRETDYWQEKLDEVQAVSVDCE